MKKLISITLLISLFGIFGVNAKSIERSNYIRIYSGSEQASDVKAYYFHGTHRCETCQAIEDISKEALMDYFGGEVEFVSINWEENEDNPIVQKYEVGGQALLIVADDQVVDLTTAAFLNALTNPDKLREKIKSTVEGLD